MFGLPHVKLGLAFELDNGSHTDTEYFRNEVLPRLTGKVRKQVLPDMSVRYNVGLRDALRIHRMMTQYCKEHPAD